ncbi:hypothetical protein COOONC_27622, partial [Cooperia oncophora]
MSLQDQLKSARDKLKPTTTVVLLEDGEEVTEHRNESGEFVRGSVEDDQNAAVKGVSNRRRKKVDDRAVEDGIVIEPDLEPRFTACKHLPWSLLG